MLLSAAVLGSVAFISSRAREDIAQKCIDNATASAVRQFDTMVDAMTQPLEPAVDWAASGKLSLVRANELNDLLFPLLKRDRLLYGISIADTRGNSYYGTARGDGWLTRRIEDIGQQRQSVVRYWNAGHRKISDETQPSTYDPRSRPWFSPALAIQGVFWTRPYIFSDRKLIGITASIARQTNTGNFQGILWIPGFKKRSKEFGCLRSK